MGRKRIHDLNSYKFTVDIGGENKKILDDLTENLNIKYGPAVNLIISTFCGMPKMIRQEFKDFCLRRYGEISNSITEAGEFERQSLREKRNYYLQMLKVLNGGKDISKEDLMMQKIPLKKGYLLCPRDWVILNPERAKDSLYAGCVECKNSRRYQIPHLLFFCDYKYTQDYPEEFLQKVNGMCIKAWPRFQSVIADQIPLIPDLTGKTDYVNKVDYLNSPVIAYYSIWEKEEMEDTPFGATIIRE